MEKVAMAQTSGVLWHSGGREEGENVVMAEGGRGSRGLGTGDFLMVKRSLSLSLFLSLNSLPFEQACARRENQIMKDDGGRPVCFRHESRLGGDVKVPGA